MPDSIVIIGAGQAGVTAAVTLRERGWEGEIHLIGEESAAPYQRPPLSKGYLSGADSSDDLLLRAGHLFERDQIQLRTGVSVRRVDRESRTVELSDGEVLAYDALIFATGSAPRALTLPGAEFDGVHVIRTVQDADSLRQSLHRAGGSVFIGGGFLGLEVAAQAAKLGSVTVLELAPQILGRVLSRESASAISAYLESLGINIRCGVQLREIEGDGGSVRAVVLADGERIPASSVVVSIGAVPRDELASECGLEVNGGIVVDSGLRTSDERIFAIGDCAKYPNLFAGIDMRVESVQNATDQARYVASVLTGGDHGPRYSAVPWFWSHQGERKLQIAGIALPDDEARLVEHDTESGKLVVERLRGGDVVAVETINAAGAHMKARRLLAEMGAR